MRQILSIGLLGVLLFAFVPVEAQCPPGQTQVVVTIVPDNYPSETSWELRDSQGNLLASASNAAGGTVCVNSTLCLTFTIFDSFGDGICCDYGNGSYTVTYGGNQVASGGQFGSSESTTFGSCPPGSNCAFADTIGLGNHVAANRNYWYIWIPDSTGTYEITTCGNNTCDTKIWVYDHCQNLQWDNTNVGTIFYNDNDCGLQARVTGHFAGGLRYWIRIGDVNSSCSGAINWALNYLGPVVGCMNPVACNYNPLATVPDTCYFPGDTLCPDGPDLIVVQSALQSSLAIGSLGNADPCHANEGCVTGYGRRDVMRFTTHIKNIGNQDYYIGNPTSNPQMFQFDNCHGHYHFDGYAEYLLYDSLSQPLPIGFKNGFCVMDLECSGGGTFQYGCSNMGISAGCGDIYSSGLDCQWIDITTVPSGRYTMVVRTNWGRMPDALGRHEKDYDNNWAQVCFRLNKDTVGTNHTFVIDPNCPPLLDCNGVPFGSAVYDCMGVCAGTALRGDLDTNQVQQVQDGNLYLSNILNSTASVSNCSDLNMDGDITVTDAALINACAIRGTAYPLPGGGTKNYCNLPSSMLNINDTVSLRIGNINLTNRTIDIEMKNPNNRVVGYQFTMSGVTLTGATSLIPVIEYPEIVQVNASGTVISVSVQDSSIKKSPVWRPMVRLQYSQATAGQACISQIVDVVNSAYEDVITKIENPCAVTVARAEPEGLYKVRVYPNPFSNSTTLEFEMLPKEKYSLDIVDLQGKTVREYGQLRSNRFTIERDNLPSGLYFYRLRGSHEQIGKLMIY